MSFTHGFFKTSTPDPIIFSGIGKAIGKGLKAGGEATVKDSLKLKGLKHVTEAVKSSGGLGKSFTTQKGREALAEGVGKAAPSIGAAAGYGIGAKKVYDKVSKGDSGQQGGGYY